MSVYVDDAAIKATVGRHTSRWSHLIADTPEELHEFAARLGLRRSYFQEPKFAGRPCKPESLAAQMWHYDVTAGKRAQAIRMGAVAVSCEEQNQIIRRRHALLFPEAAAELERKRAAAFEKWHERLAGSGDGDSSEGGGGR